MTTPWPPVIGAAHVPLWARVRDVVLTVAAWLLLAYLLMPMLRALWSQVQVALGLLQSAPAVEWLWTDLRPFFGLVALLILWMLCYAAVRKLVLTHNISIAPRPRPLDRATHVEYLGLSSEDAGRLHHARVMVVEFDDAFRISVIDAPEPRQGRTPRPRAD